MENNPLSIKIARAKLLRYIIQTRFEEAFGPNWWERELLFHMREESMKGDSPNGIKYNVALQKYGRQIKFEDLDTTILCTIILFDNYFKEKDHLVTYTDYESNIVWQLHNYRNRVSHEEGDVIKALEAERKTLRTMREAVDKMDLMNKNPELAQEILKAYFTAFNSDIKSSDEQKFLEISAKFEEAEKYLRWNPEKAKPIYEELAEQGFQAAQERLLFMYTQTVPHFNLVKAYETYTKYPSLLSEEQGKKLRGLMLSFPHLIWGTPSICTAFKSEMENGSLIKNPAISQYITIMNAEYPSGLTSLANSDNTAPDTLVQLKKIRCNLDVLEANISKAPCPELSQLLLDLARGGELNASATIQTVKELGKAGCMPIIEYYATKGNTGMNIIPENHPSVYWIRLGAEKSDICKALLTHIQKPESKRFEKKPEPQQNNQSFEKYELQIKALQDENKRLKTYLKVAGLVVVALIVTLLTH